VNGWGVFVLVVMAVPVVLVAVVCVADARHNRRVRDDPSTSVEGIRRRLAQEQAEAELASHPTEVLPRIQPPDGHEHARRSRPQPRRPPEDSGQVSMQRVVEGLQRLPSNRKEPDTTPLRRHLDR
jgi:hypothetical protein